MVKNTHGGSGHKKFARKFTTPKSNNRLRISEDEGEIYAIVTKMLGNNMFHCFCMDNVLRLGHIRGKFTGRGKRDNMISPGSWILIGVREWDLEKTITDSKAKLPQCDLLEVYTESDKERLTDSVSEDWNILMENDVSKTALTGMEKDNDIFKFSTDKDIEREKFIEEMNSSTAKRVTLKIQEIEQEEQEQEEINIDDI